MDYKIPGYALHTALSRYITRTATYIPRLYGYGCMEAPEYPMWNSLDTCAHWLDWWSGALSGGGLMCAPWPASRAQTPHRTPGCIRVWPKT